MEVLRRIVVFIFTLTHVIGDVNRCQWEAKIVESLELHSNVFIRPRPSATPIDVSDTLNKLRLFGTDINQGGNVLAYRYSVRLELQCPNDEDLQNSLHWSAMNFKAQPVVTFCIRLNSHQTTSVCFQREAVLFESYAKIGSSQCIKSVGPLCKPFWVLPFILASSDELVSVFTVEMLGSTVFPIASTRFVITLEDDLGRSNDAVAASSLNQYHVTRCFKQVPLNCVSRMVGPFGVDKHYLVSSTGFYPHSSVFRTSFEQYFSEEQSTQWSRDPCCDCDIESDVANLPGRLLFASKHGVLLVRGGDSSGRTERLIPELCVGQMDLHTVDVKITIVLHGACGDTGKVFVATTTMSIYGEILWFPLADSIETSPSPCYIFYSNSDSCTIIDVIPSSSANIYFVLLQPDPERMIFMKYHVTDEYWETVSSWDSETFNHNSNSFLLSGFRIMPFSSHHIYIWGPKILLYSGDYGVNFTVVGLPATVTLQQVTPGTIGKWLAILTEAGHKEQEIHFLIVGFPEVRKIFPDKLIRYVSTMIGLSYPDNDEFYIISLFVNNQHQLTMLIVTSEHVVSQVLLVEQLLRMRQQTSWPSTAPLDKGVKLCPYKEIIFRFNNMERFQQHETYLLFAPRLSNSFTYDLQQYLVHNAILYQIVLKRTEYSTSPSKYTDYKFFSIASLTNPFEDTKDYSRYLLSSPDQTERDMCFDVNNFRRVFDSIGQRDDNIPSYVWLDFKSNFTFSITLLFEDEQKIRGTLKVVSSDLALVLASFTKEALNKTDVYQVTLQNISPLQSQFTPGYNTTYVGVDIYMDGAAMNCYQSSDPSPRYATNEPVSFRMDNDDVTVRNDQGLYHITVVSGCPVSHSVLFNWNRSLSEYIRYSDHIMSDCYPSNSSMPCFNYNYPFYPHFISVDSAMGKFSEFDGKYMLKIVAFAQSLSTEPTYFTDEEIFLYNNQLHAQPYYSIWRLPDSATHQGWPVFQRGNPGIEWLCELWSPCSIVFPVYFNKLPELFFLIEFTNAFSPTMQDEGTFCNHTMRFWIHLNGFRLSKLFISLPLMLGTVIALGLFSVVYFVSKRRKK